MKLKHNHFNDLFLSNKIIHTGTIALNKCVINVAPFCTACKLVSISVDVCPKDTTIPLLDNSLMASIEPSSSGAKVTILIFSKLPYVFIKLSSSKVFMLVMSCAPRFKQLMNGPSTCAPKIAAPCWLS